MIKQRLAQIGAAITARLHLDPGEKKTILLLAVVVGLLAGGAAALLKYLIGKLTHLLTGGIPAGEPSLWFILIPVAGVFIAALYCRYIARANVEHGCEKIADALKASSFRLPSKLTVTPIIASTITLGCGGSAGSEGPIAYTGAAIGSNVGKFFGCPPQALRLLIGCGAGAGIAGIFKAPIGGALFTLEYLGLGLSTITVLALIICCVIAGMTALAWSGFTLDVNYIPHVPFESWTFWAIILLGVFTGLYSLYYSFWMSRVEKFYDRFRHPWLKWLVSGLTIGVLLFLFPTLYGEGYGVGSQLIDGSTGILSSHSIFKGSSEWVLPAIVAATLAVKAIATQSTNSGGGVGGDFAPTLFSGALAGYLFATVANMWLGCELPVANFALYGMAGVMAGAIKAPLMAMFLVAEMTGDYAMFFPIMVTAGVSWLLVRLSGRRFGIRFHHRAN